MATRLVRKLAVAEKNMCGRYTITNPAEIIDEALGVLGQSAWLADTGPGLRGPQGPGLRGPQGGLQGSSLRPRYNLAPTQEAPILRPIDGELDGVAAGEVAGAVAVRQQRWGLVARHARGPDGAPRINARVETVMEKPSFRDSIRDRRCLVPADGFFEWTAKRVGHQPHWLTLDGGRGFCFAGIWDRWRPPRGEALDSFTILTGAPNESVAWVHDRMPLVVPRGLYESWVDVAAGEVENLLVRLREEQPQWDAIPVGDAVNRVANDSAALLREVPPVPRNLTLF